MSDRSLLATVSVLSLFIFRMLCGNSYILFECKSSTVRIGAFSKCCTCVSWLYPSVIVSRVSDLGTELNVLKLFWCRSSITSEVKLDKQSFSTSVSLFFAIDKSLSSDRLPIEAGTTLS